MDGWTRFAEMIIKELLEYDIRNKTNYAYYLDEPSGPPALAEVMARVDKQNQWEPIPQKVKHHD